MSDELKAFARAIASANGHPDPEAYAEHVAEKYTPPATPAPAEPAPVEPAPAA